MTVTVKCPFCISPQTLELKDLGTANENGRVTMRYMVDGVHDCAAAPKAVAPPAPVRPPAGA